jgi:hypothetical protein
VRVVFAIAAVLLLFNFFFLQTQSNLLILNLLSLTLLILCHQLVFLC